MQWARNQAVVHAAISPKFSRSPTPFQVSRSPLSASLSLDHLHSFNFGLWSSKSCGLDWLHSGHVLMPVSRTSKFLQGTGVSVFASIAAFVVWTKHIYWEDISPATDLIFRSNFYQKYNPSSNPALQDVCVRKIPAFKLKPELVQDAQAGGTKLVEHYCAGVWMGSGKLMQYTELAVEWLLWNLSRFPVPVYIKHLLLCIEKCSHHHYC